MKYVILALSLITTLAVFAQEKVEIKSGASLELNYADFQTSMVEINNTSLKPFDVHVEDSSSKQWVMGFGMGPKGKEVVNVKPTQTLILTNDSDKDIQVELKFIKRKAPEGIVNTNQTITFTLHNSSAKSIPLIIPNVMNPNLSPFSNSGVNLKVGQKIYYKKKGKKKLLLTVDASIEEGSKIDVAERIQELEKK